MNRKWIKKTISTSLLFLSICAFAKIVLAYPIMPFSFIKKKSGTSGVINSTPGTSCKNLKNGGNTTSGLYNIFNPTGIPSNTFTTYCDMTTDGGGWTLIAYADNAQLASKLNSASGTYQTNRRGQFQINATIFTTNASPRPSPSPSPPMEIAIAWTPASVSTYPTGDIGTYPNAFSFPLTNPGNLDFSMNASPADGGGSNQFSTINTNLSERAFVSLTNRGSIQIIGSSNGQLPSHMYYRPLTFGVDYGNSYGLVMSDNSNSQLDYNYTPDGQAFKFIYFRHTNIGKFIPNPGGGGNQVYINTLSLWIR